MIRYAYHFSDFQRRGLLFTPGTLIPTLVL